MIMMRLHAIFSIHISTVSIGMTDWSSEAEAATSVIVELDLNNLTVENISICMKMILSRQL